MAVAGTYNTVELNAIPGCQSLHPVDYRMSMSGSDRYLLPHANSFLKELSFL